MNSFQASIFTRPGGTLLCACLLACSNTFAQHETQRGAGRLMPPSVISCDRNQLTSWTGEVSAYRREGGELMIEIETDYGTVESTKFNYDVKAGQAHNFLLWGETFETTDWPEVEQTPGVLKEGMRATAWICDDGKTAPVIDWRPPGD